MAGSDLPLEKLSLASMWEGDHKARVGALVLVGDSRGSGTREVTVFFVNVQVGLGCQRRVQGEHLFSRRGVGGSSGVLRWRPWARNASELCWEECEFCGTPLPSSLPPQRAGKHSDGGGACRA